jgi:CcmD family protein
MTYLYAAYIATWAIHVGYLATLLRRYSRLRKTIEEFSGRIQDK